ncbi:unnamed protein product, partial [marine sediment metagenome]
AGYIAFKINPSETSIGSGEKNLFWAGVGGSGKVVINNDGYVGIGTTTPAYTLDIFGTLRATGTTTLATTGGRVGIGTTTPSEALTVVGNIFGVGNAVFTGTITSQSGATSSFAGPLTITTTTQPQLTIAYNSSNYLTASVSSAGTTTLASTGALTIEAEGDLTVTAGDNIIFTSAGTEIMRIASSTGYVGIATSSPQYPLHVWGDAAFGTTTTPTLFVDADTGRVGVGTTVPQQKLTLTSGSNFAMEMARPTNVSAATTTATSTLSAGDYYFKVVASDGVGTTIVSSEASTTAAANETISVSW